MTEGFDLDEIERLLALLRQRRLSKDGIRRQPQKHERDAADLIETQAREIERLREALEREEYGHCKSIEERDYAEEYISRIYRTVTGKTAEWSNRFGFAEALDDIRAALGETQ